MALEDFNVADPCAGWVIGQNEIVCRFSSTLYLALRGDQFVVLKRVAVDAGGVHDLELHAEAEARISHPNLAKVYALDTTEEGSFWVTELHAGATLTELRAACRKAGKSLPIGLVFATFHEVALALGELHGRRRAHGDLSDDNILLGFSGTSKLLNAGVADCMQRLPPDPQKDIFSLAGLLYECLTGSRPNGPAIAPPSSYNHALEKPIDDFLARALGPIRSKRFKTGAEFAAALKTAASGYLWKPGQRADFVFGLFKKRREKEQELLAGSVKRLDELRAARAAEKAAAELAAAQAAFVAVAPRAAHEPEPAIVAGEMYDDDANAPMHVNSLAPEVLSVPWRAVKIGLSATVAIAACVFLVQLLAGAPASIAGAAVLAPPIPIMVPVAIAPPEPPPAAPAALPEEAKMASAEDEPTPPEAAPQKPAVKKKKKADEPPLPPWLQRKGRR
ncbi:MAG: protein kinase [Myxococcaceae bacterium]|nr:protein kinase [Myxococcaceae bacterium]